MEIAACSIRSVSRCSCYVFNHVECKYVTLGPDIKCKAHKGPRQKKKRKCNIGILIGGLRADELH